MQTTTQGDEVRKIQIEVLRKAARIAELEESPIAVDIWNRACHRISQLLEAEAAKMEHY